MNKTKIIVGAIITTFLGLGYKLRNIKNILNSNQSISNCWYQDKNISEIMQTPTEKLTEDLLQVICDKYSGVDAMANSSIPMAKFLLAIETEKNMLLTYVKIAKILTTLKLARIFFVDIKILDGHKERLAKLAYMQKLFEDFMSKSCKQRISSTACM